MSHAKTLRELLAAPGVLKAPGVYDGLSSLLVERAGFPVAFLSGACLAFARFGRPDMGLVSAAEVASTISDIRERISLPLIVDGDTGFGNALNVQRTVRTFEQAGASAIQFEDQVSPKRCGHMAGKDVISASEMVGKIKAALDARTNDATVIIARTDALGVRGFEDAIERAELYLEAGADALFIEAPKTTAEMQEISKRFAGRTPLIHNLVEGGKSPVASADDLADLGYKIALYPAALLNLFVPAAQEILAHILDNGSTDGMRDRMADLHILNDLLGAPELIKQAAQYS